MKNETITKTVTYGTIENMKVEIPATYSVYELAEAFAKAYVEYTQAQGGLFSDEVMFNSIGAANAKRACVDGFAANYPWADGFLSYLKKVIDEDWPTLVLVARYGAREGTAKALVRSGYTPERAQEIASKLAK